MSAQGTQYYLHDGVPLLLEKARRAQNAHARKARWYEESFAEIFDEVNTGPCASRSEVVRCGGHPSLVNVNIGHKSHMAIGSSPGLQS
jgi:hypothetical protein